MTEAVSPLPRWTTPRSLLEGVSPRAPGLDGVAVLCIAEDGRGAEREVIPPLQTAGLIVDLQPAVPFDALNLDRRAYGLVLFDINSPDGVGYHLCAQIRGAFSIPLMLVLRGAARESVVRGYDAGADSCVLAPFDPREFVARVTALLRRQALRVYR